jgi:hypothetical protein
VSTTKRRRIAFCVAEQVVARMEMNMADAGAGCVLMTLWLQLGLQSAEEPSDLLARALVGQLLVSPSTIFYLPLHLQNRPRHHRRHRHHC